MRKDSEFHDYVLYDLLGGDPHITSRKMFGGYGLYLDGAIFGLIIDDILYFKVDDANRDEFVSRGSAPFRYHNGKREVTMCYWDVPNDIIEDRELINKWVGLSAEISRNTKKKSK